MLPRMQPTYRTLDDLNAATARHERARAVSIIARSFLAGHRNPAVFAELLGERPNVVEHVRAAVPPLTTGSALATSPEVRAFLELSATRRLLPQLGATEVPMNMTGVFASDEDVVASWLLQGQGWIPFESFVTDNRTLTPFSFGLGISETRELMRRLDPIGTRLAATN